MREPFAGHAFRRSLAAQFIVLAGLLVFFTASAADVLGQQQTQQQSSPQQQQMPRAPKIQVQVKTVSVLATVRDKHGKIVPNLTKDDFLLDEDGRPQTITYFARETDLPLRLGLLVDTSFSQRSVLEQERSASYTFLDQMLRQDKDLAFVIHFDREVELLQDFTGSRPKLQAALQSLNVPQMGGYGGGQSGGGQGTDGGPHQRGGRGRGGGTLLYDAVYLASDELMSKQQGRKALIVLTDGVDRGSKETLATAIETAQRADTVVYSILFAGEEGHGGSSHGGFGMGGPRGPYGGRQRRFPEEQRPDGKKILEQISKETGGRMFQVSKKETVDKIYAEIQEELRNQYSLGYTPDQGAGPGYHKIHLVTKQKDLIVQARDGYYGAQ
ncbi:MAG TPA: VWA domain-containing protein [Candidatus Acidoferrum sp.]|nr:VWA domain-containing protein [Candidatus Acidoferrum sp.]